jgi:glycosyltransferase involved in cell wall biosynthesis
MAPLVSVILPVFDREASVGRAIDSVLAQTHEPLELIVVDDGSTDGTREVLAGFGGRIVIAAQPHSGPYVARNHGLRLARGELVAFLDSDDAWLPHRLVAQLPLLGRPEVGLVFGDAVCLGPRRRHLTCFRISPPRRGRVAAHLAWANFVPTVTVLVRRRCLDEAGGFVPGSLAADYLTWFRIALRHELDFVEQPVAEYSVHPGGISADLGRSLAARLQLFTDELERTGDAETRAVLRHLLFNLSLHLALAAVRGRARSVARPLRLAWRTAGAVTGGEAGTWIAAFLARQLWLRTGRPLPVEGSLG